MDMPIATTVTVDTLASHGEVLADLLAGDRVSRLGGGGCMGRLSGSGGWPCRAGSKDGRVGFDEVLQVGNYLVPAQVLLLRQLERLDSQSVVSWKALEQREALEAVALRLPLLVHEVGHPLHMCDVGGEVSVVFELRVSELAAKLVKRDLVLLEVSMAQLPKDALDMALGDTLELFSLCSGHVALHDAPCLLAVDVLGVEVEVGFDSVCVIDVDVLQASVPEVLPASRVEEVVHEGPPGLKVALARKQRALEHSQHAGVSLGRHDSWKGSSSSKR